MSAGRIDSLADNIDVVAAVGFATDLRAEETPPTPTRVLVLPVEGIDVPEGVEPVLAAETGRSMRRRVAWQSWQ